MAVVLKKIKISSKGNTDIIDITDQINSVIVASKLKNGIACISVPGSTGAISTCEYEPGLIQDLKDVFQRLAPKGDSYHHDNAWHDGNGHSHVRASLLGGSKSFPFSNSSLVLGTWQQIIFIDFDNRPRQRTIVVQCVGE